MGFGSRYKTNRARATSSGGSYDVPLPPPPRPGQRRDFNFGGIDYIEEFNGETGRWEPIYETDPYRGGGGSYGPTPEELALQRQQLALEELLGLGSLEVDRGNLWLTGQRYANDYELGRGNLWVDATRTANDYELGRGQLDLDKWFGAIDRILAERGLEHEMGIDTRRLDLESELGRGNLELDRYLGTRQADLAHDLGFGQLGLDTELGRARIGLEQGDLDLRRTLGLGDLALDRDRMALERELGLGDFGLRKEELAARLRTAELENQLRKQEMALQSSSARANALMRAQEAADARRMNAVNATRDFLGFMVPEGMEYAPGFEPGGALAASAASYGLPFNTMKMPTTRVDVNSLAQVPMIDPQLAQQISAMGVA